MIGVAVIIILGGMMLAMVLAPLFPFVSAEPLPAELREPVSLPNNLANKGSEEARMIAEMIINSDPRRWNIESDHCHYYGRPAMTFAYIKSYRRGLYPGSKDLDMYDQAPIISDQEDLVLIETAVDIVRMRKSRLRAIQAQARKKILLREMVGKRDRFMAEIRK